MTEEVEVHPCGCRAALWAFQNSASGGLGSKQMEGIYVKESDYGTLEDGRGRPFRSMVATHGEREQRTNSYTL